jgi:hypothetical protein
MINRRDKLPRKKSTHREPFTVGGVKEERACASASH